MFLDLEPVEELEVMLEAVEDLEGGSEFMEYPGPLSMAE
jgi:hypothetical protein